MANNFSSNAISALLFKYKSDIEKYKGLINKELEKGNQDEDFLETLDEYAEKLSFTCCKYNTINYYFNNNSLNTVNTDILGMNTSDDLLK